MNINNNKQVIIISGATSVGKSAVARELCKTINAEIILADSVQIYKYMDIGSNKPTIEEMNEIPHHMVNICEPNDPYSGGDFVKQAAPIIYDILNRGKVPVIVGGSTMWIQWLVHGMPDAPKAENIDVNKAQELIGQYEESGDWDSAMNIVSMYDKTRVEKIGENDWYRLRRYLEVALAVRRIKGYDVNTNDISADDNSEDELLLTGDREPALPGIDIRAFFVSEDREHLYRWIDSRCEAMINSGLFEEVTDVLLGGKLLPDSIASKAIGIDYYHYNNYYYYYCYHYHYNCNY
jgi:tRNA dimethylallyltransferase